MCIYLVVYVDDIVITSNDQDFVKDVDSKLDITELLL